MPLFTRVRRSVAKTSSERVDPLDLLFDRQQLVIDDRARFKALLCGRRAGKTDVAIKDFAAGMLAEPYSLNLFVAQTIGSARNILWRPFERLNAEHKWGFKFTDSKGLQVSHPNGSLLLVRGSENKRDLEFPRGVGFRRIRIDECGAQRPSYLQYLVEDVLQPTLMDHPGSDMWLLGTPTIQAYGYFYDITTKAKPGFSVHGWTAKQNPHVDYHSFIHNPIEHPSPGILALRNWTEDNPVFKREYLAEWCLDSDRLVYRFARERNIVQALPALQPGDQWQHILALDFGVNHKTAAAVIAYPKIYGRDAYVVHTWAKHGLAPSAAATLIANTYREYKPVAVVGDSGGLGKAFIQELVKRHPDIPMRPAEKAQKRAAMEFTSDALYTAVSTGDSSRRFGLMSLPCNENLHREWATLQWDEKREDVAEGQDDDLSHAAMYGYRLTPAFANAQRPDPPEPDVRGTTLQFMPKPKYQVPERLRSLADGWLGPKR